MRQSRLPNVRSERRFRMAPRAGLDRDAVVQAAVRLADARRGEDVSLTEIVCTPDRVRSVLRVLGWGRQRRDCELEWLGGVLLRIDARSSLLEEQGGLGDRLARTRVAGRGSGRGCRGRSLGAGNAGRAQERRNGAAQRDRHLLLLLVSDESGKLVSRCRQRHPFWPGEVTFVI